MLGSMIDNSMKDLSRILGAVFASQTNFGNGKYYFKVNFKAAIHGYLG